MSDTLRRDDFTHGHDPGRVLVDVVVMTAAGDMLRIIDVLRHQENLCGDVASPATLCRTLGEIDSVRRDQTVRARPRGRTRRAA